MPPSRGVVRRALPSEQFLAYLIMASILYFPSFGGLHSKRSFSITLIPHDVEVFFPGVVNPIKYKSPIPHVHRVLVVVELG